MMMVLVVADVRRRMTLMSGAGEDDREATTSRLGAER